MSDDQRDSEGERSGEEADAGAKEGPSSEKAGPTTEGAASDGGGEQPRSATPSQRASPPSKETPPAKNDDARYIKLRVVGNVSNQDSNGINFRLKWTTALLKLKKSYSNHVGIPISNLRFLFDGRRITDEDTPKQLDMNDDDQIEVYHEQTGGC